MLFISKAHNNIIQKNMWQLKYFIGASFGRGGGWQELFFHGHRTQNYSNRENCTDLMPEMSDFDSMIKNYLNNLSAFSGLSSCLPIHDLFCQYIFLRNKHEINGSSFIPVTMNKTTAISRISQLSTLIHYIKKMYWRKIFGI